MMKISRLTRARPSTTIDLRSFIYMRRSYADEEMRSIVTEFIKELMYEVKEGSIANYSSFGNQIR